MAVPRLAGGKSVTLVGPMRMSPSVAPSWPAIILSVDVLPQPEGPSRQQ